MNTQSSFWHRALPLLGFALLLSCEQKSPPPAPVVASAPVATPAAPASLRVSALTGQASFCKLPDTSWIALQVGKKVEAGMALRTLQETTLELVASDGSSLTVSEWSRVSVDTLLEQTGLYKARLAMQKGSLHFKIPKIAGSSKDISFATPTAVAAIRGTEGSLYVTSQSTIAYLQSGKLWLRDNTTRTESTLEAKQAAVQTPKGFTVRNLATEGEHRSFIDSVQNIVKKLNVPALLSKPQSNALPAALQQAASKTPLAAQQLAAQKLQIEQKAEAIKKKAQLTQDSLRQAASAQKARAQSAVNATVKKQAPAPLKNLKKIPGMP